MSNRKLQVRCGLVAVFLLLVAGCVKRELEGQPGGRVRITYDWKNLAEGTSLPSGMELWFYRADNTFLDRQSSATAYEGALPAGNNRVIIYNPDASGMNFKDMDRFEDAQAYLLTDAQGFLQQPSALYGLSLPAFTVSEGTPTHTTVTPVAYTRTVILHVKTTGDYAASITAMQATIEGMAARLNLATGKPVPGDNGKITQMLTTAGTGYDGRFTTFGGDEQNPGKLTLTITMSDGSLRTVSRDITEALRQLNQQDSNVPLVIDLTLDLTQIDGVFVAVIQDWSYTEGETEVN